ncbi:MAG TPA: hypothetical protein VH268_09650 [Solirubrobacterales bacterium]|nr:hypothetical protein [Solirubrobacterales bacterium]
MVDRPVSAPRRAAVAETVIGRIRDRAPEGVEVVAIEKGLDLETVDFLVPFHSGRWVLQALPNLTRLAVVQVLSAGTDWIEGRLPPQATLCSARGARDAPVAEWVVAALLGASSRTLECARLETWTDTTRSPIWRAGRSSSSGWARSGAMWPGGSSRSGRGWSA